IDGAVIEASKKWFPTISSGLDNPRVKTLIKDGLVHIREAEDEYDVIIIDSSDPVGPGVQLFEVPFYQDCRKALRENGLLVAQTESPWANDELVVKTFRNMKSVFPVAKIYLGNVPTYPSGL